MITLDERQLQNQLRAAVGQLVQGADTPRSLALTCSRSSAARRADAADRPSARCGWHSEAATQALFTAAQAVGPRVVAEIKEASAD